jgi:hypothetical protein
MRCRELIAAALGGLLLALSGLAAPSAALADELVAGGTPRSTQPVGEARLERLDRQVFLRVHWRSGLEQVVPIGRDVSALAERGKFFPGQYVIVFQNGQDTFNYAATCPELARPCLVVIWPPDPRR